VPEEHRHIRLTEKDLLFSCAMSSISNLTADLQSLLPEGVLAPLLFTIVCSIIFVVFLYKTSN